MWRRSQSQAFRHLRMERLKMRCQALESVITGYLDFNRWRELVGRQPAASSSELARHRRSNGRVGRLKTNPRCPSPESGRTLPQISQRNSEVTRGREPEYSPRRAGVLPLACHGIDPRVGAGRASMQVRAARSARRSCDDARHREGVSGFQPAGSGFESLAAHPCVSNGGLRGRTGRSPATADHRP